MMIIDKQSLFIFFLFIAIIHGLPSNSFYLIDIDQNLSSNESYCSNIIINSQIYRIPQQCQQHLLCDPYHCDDKSFRCIKIRETLCCLYKYFQINCPKDNFNQMKDRFRSIYFQMSIEHGYCEINLERIEKNDQAYCIANIEETAKQTITTTSTTTNIYSTSRSTFKHYHRHPSSSRPNRYRHRIAPRQNYSSLTNLDYLRRVTIIEQNLPSKCSRSLLDYYLLIILVLSIY